MPASGKEFEFDFDCVFAQDKSWKINNQVKQFELEISKRNFRKDSTSQYVEEQDETVPAIKALKFKPAVSTQWTDGKLSCKLNAIQDKNEINLILKICASADKEGQSGRSHSRGKACLGSVSFKKIIETHTMEIILRLAEKDQLSELFGSLINEFPPKIHSGPIEPIGPAAISIGKLVIIDDCWMLIDSKWIVDVQDILFFGSLSEIGEKKLNLSKDECLISKRVARARPKRLRLRSLNVQNTCIKPNETLIEQNVIQKDSIAKSNDLSDSENSAADNLLKKFRRKKARLSAGKELKPVETSLLLDHSGNSDCLKLSSSFKNENCPARHASDLFQNASDCNNKSTVPSNQTSRMPSLKLAERKSSLISNKQSSIPNKYCQLRVLGGNERLEVKFHFLRDISRVNSRNNEGSYRKFGMYSGTWNSQITLLGSRTASKNQLNLSGYDNFRVYCRTLWSLSAECLNIKLFELSKQVLKKYDFLERKSSLKQKSIDLNVLGTSIKKCGGLLVEDVSVDVAPNSILQSSGRDDSIFLKFPDGNPLPENSFNNFNSAGKDDIWFLTDIKMNPNLESSKAILLRSNWFRPTNEGILECSLVNMSDISRLKTIVGAHANHPEFETNGYRKRLRKTNFNSIVAFRLLNANTEFAVLDHLFWLEENSYPSFLLSRVPLFQNLLEYRKERYMIESSSRRSQGSIKDTLDIPAGPIPENNAKYCWEITSNFIDQYNLNVDQAKVCMYFIGSLINWAPDTDSLYMAKFFGLKTNSKQCDGWSNHPIMLCHGVFGAGKSFLVAVLILIIYEIAITLGLDENIEDGADTYDCQKTRLRILVSSNTNVAVDRILLSLKKMDFDKLVRIGNVKKVHKQLLAKMLSSSHNEDIKELQNMLKAGDLNPEEEWNIREAIKSFKDDEIRSKLADSFVVGTTCISAGTSGSFNKLSETSQNQNTSNSINECSVNFPIVILDECSQMTEALSLLPLAKYGTIRALIIGDPLQLPPTVPPGIDKIKNWKIDKWSPSKSGLQAEIRSDGTLKQPLGGIKIVAGVERTLFERMIQLGVPSIQLRTQYRCHPLISRLSSDLFYGGCLLDGTSSQDREPLIPGLPTISFIDVLDGQEQISKGGSFINSVEADYIVKTVRAILRKSKENDVESNTFSMKDMGIISAYKAQVELLSKMTQSGKYSTSKNHSRFSSDNLDEEFDFADAVDDKSAITISTVDAFQGGERELMILSSVRSNTKSVGFSDDPRRMNVAITRARRHLIIFGHRQTLVNSKLWSSIINYCRCQGHLYNGVSEFLRKNLH